MPRTSAPIGRPPATSRLRIEGVAFRLFRERGFEQVTVEEIASAAGIGRRTFFRYFQSKNDVVWGDFDEHLNRFRADLAATDPGVPMGRALVDAVVAFNTYPPQEVQRHRERMELILTVPDLQANSALQYRAWRDTVAAFVASRTGGQPDDLEAQVVSQTALGAAVAAYDHWLKFGDRSLTGIMTEALLIWSRGLNALTPKRRPRDSQERGSASRTNSSNRTRQD